MAALGGVRQLFRSDHLYDRVGLTTLLRKCAVTFHGAAATTAAAGTGCPSYECVAQLDHEVMALTALPPGCGGPGSNGNEQGPC
jgi:hypothetical protein